MIVELHPAGSNLKAIIKATKYPKSTVHDVVKQLKGGKGIGHSPCSPHKAKKRTPRFVAGLNKSIKANPSLSMAVPASRRSVSRRMVSRAIKEDLGLKSFVRERQHLLTSKMKEIRFKRGKKLKQLCKVNQGVVRLLSDESNFTVDRAFNPQNNCCLAQTKSNIPPVMKMKHPSQIMVFGLITSDG